jgi:hypothetical protein
MEIFFTFSLIPCAKFCPQGFWEAHQEKQPVLAI